MWDFDFLNPDKGFKKSKSLIMFRETLAQIHDISIYKKYSTYLMSFPPEHKKRYKHLEFFLQNLVSKLAYRCLYIIFKHVGVDRTQ